MVTEVRLSRRLEPDRRGHSWCIRSHPMMEPCRSVCQPVIDPNRIGPGVRHHAGLRSCKPPDV